VNKPQSSKTLLKFPCDFTLKAIGANDPEFEKSVLAVIKKYFPRLKKNAITCKNSKEGKYLAMSITFKAKSKKQLDSIYKEINTCKQVVMTL
jgi:uncharacterized protein